MTRVEQDVSIVSFSAPARVLSWAVLKGGFYADHIVNHRVCGNNGSFCDQPRSWLQRAATDLGLHGKVVAMATVVKMETLSQASGGAAEVTCFATVGCGNALSAGDPCQCDAGDSGAAVSAHDQYYHSGSARFVGSGHCRGNPNCHGRTSASSL